MLRALVVAFVLANLAFFVWTQGWLDGLVGVRASGDREPERLARQVHPDSVRIASAAPANGAAAPASGAGDAADAVAANGGPTTVGLDGAAGPAGTATGTTSSATSSTSSSTSSGTSAAPSSSTPTGTRAGSAPTGADAVLVGADLPRPAQDSCLQAGPFSDAQLRNAQTYLRGLVPAQTTTTVETIEPGTWIVYMGRFANREALTKKEDELKRRKLVFDEFGEATELGLGLSLGRYSSPDSAAAALEAFGALGVHTARVTMLRPARTLHRVRIEHADSALAGRLTALQASELGAGFVPCLEPTSH